MQSTSIPTKYLVPFAQNDSAKVSIPVTTTDATRASQSLGFPPLTGQPPEAGGVPPQLEDFNGALNQIAAVAWWLMAGGSFPFDSTFAAATQIAGYPLGAKVPSVDAKGAWISTVEANTVNPDTDTVLTSWVPGHQYGITALTGLTGGTVTLTGAQASKKAITLAGVLTSNLILVMPTWFYDWRITNNTTGAFTVTVKTSAGAGVVCTNGGVTTPVIGDGTNIVSQTTFQNLLVPTATASTQQPLPIAQADTRYALIQVVANGQCRLTYSSTTAVKLVPIDGNNIIVNGATLVLPLAGLSVTNSGLAASTFYYLYLSGTTAAPVLSFSTTGYVTAANGTTVKSGDATQALVGAVLTTTSSTFSATNNFYGVISWFNKRPISMQPASSAGTITATTPTEINSLNRCTFIAWASTAVQCTACGYGTDTVSQAALVLGIGFNSATVTSGQIAQGNAPFAGAACGLSTTFTPSITTENQAQYLTPLGQVSTGSGSFQIINSVTFQG